MTQCRHIMKRNVQCLSAYETATLAAQKMREENLGFLPVCDDAMKILGTITDRDIALRIVGEDRAASTRVDEIMTREIVACHPEDDIARAERLMSEHRKSRIMCVDHDDCLVGVISLSDLAEFDPRQAAVALNRVSRRETRSQAS